jgi:hypothetical protein
MMRAMDTMMIKPLFPDGFVNDSDSEAEAGLDISDDEEEESEETPGPSSRDMDEDENPRADDDLTKPTTSSTKRRPSVSGAKGKAAAGGGAAPQDKTVTLGQLLTNVVILEEVVKEVVAVAQVRRGLGVDKVRFL